jgi:hypothetical protein
MVRLVTAFVISALLAGSAHAQAVGGPAGFREVSVRDVDGNKLWDSVEKAKQVMMRDAGIAREPAISISDTLQFLAQESLLNVGKPDIFDRVYRAQVRELACMNVRLSPMESGQLLTILQASFVYNELVSKSYQLMTDDMLKQAQERPDTSDGGCPDRRWRRNFYAKLPAKPKSLSETSDQSLDRQADKDTGSETDATTD